ncbi:MAG: FAD/FMN-containing dehydrogenase [Myxococcota bacterium]|jgi:FAD/FMN-containing dehydrogenase
MLSCVVLASTLLSAHAMPGDDGRQVWDVTELTPVPVSRVVAPRSVDELQDLLRTHDGPVSIGGGRFSMGGQIASEHTLFLDMRQLDTVIGIDTDDRTIRVQAGATWRTIQEAIDPHDLSLAIMQSYANFTVGGSMSVNGHGRYVNRGALALAVREFTLCLADGSLIRASPTENSELFYGVIGGYGSLGVIVEAVLDLEPNDALERQVVWMPRDEYGEWFETNILGSDDAVMHNADIYPPRWDEVASITYAKTDRAVTVPDRLQRSGPSSVIDKLMFYWGTELPYGREVRASWAQPRALAEDLVVWRNWEASYDAAGLEPFSRSDTTYVLLEFFIPVGQFDAFAADMVEIYERYDAKILNVSIRHATGDPTVMAWAREPVFAFVVYYAQGTAPWEQEEVAIWTRELVDATLEQGGTYYLPYQIHPTPAQFHSAYPRADDLFLLKAAVDPDYRFRNRLLETYVPPPASDHLDDVAERLARRDDWARPEDQTYLTLPEWYIVHSADEIGAFLATEPPSAYPWFGAIGQYWGLYNEVWGLTSQHYPFNTGYHVMLGTIGAFTTVEYGAKGAWEGTLGRLTAGGADTPDDRFNAALSVEYAAFIHHTPWYAFPWGERLSSLWADSGGPWSLRRAERRLGLTLELGSKWLSSMVIGWGTGATYGEAAGTLLAWVHTADRDALDVDGVDVVESLSEGEWLVSLPRYEPFTEAVPALAEAGVVFREIAGNRRVALTVIARDDWDRAHLWGTPIRTWPLLTEPGSSRVALDVPVAQLHTTLSALAAEPVTLDHVYDY